jgi:hypothetical protein
MTTLIATDAARVALIGIGATAAMDLWLWLLQRFGVPTLDFAFIGRWVGHLARGRWSHEAIGRSPAVRGERALGWLTHYAVGIAFAALLVAAFGMDWVARPSLLPALAVGVATVAAPLLVMLPAMGAKRNVARSVANHAVFGLGLYLSAWLLAR